ncbi:NAD-dependent epimerase/dehydratase family protein [Knoellia sp. CPCC 206435]|uniref:NAD-dependent epimerase/dehydratase family protein n=1 Tax=Knoellia terrae TaxID=3404797 RepID=UPI003B435B98
MDGVDKAVTSPMRIALVGASGFVGGAVLRELQRDHEVIRIGAPRLSTGAATVSSLKREAEQVTFRFPTRCDVVINAAGMAAPSSASSHSLFGANTLLPLVLQRAAIEVGADRMLHISSAAVQGRAVMLDESPSWFPESPYAQSKALAEQALLSSDSHFTTILRPTSVHGHGRAITASLARLARSPMSTVASPGTDPTPQVHVSNVARAVRYMVEAEDPPRIALQPSEGLTTSGILRLLGGRDPSELPRSTALSTLAVGSHLAKLVDSGRLRAAIRRLEMLWFGQKQDSGWLDHKFPDLTVPCPLWNELRP